VRIEAGETIFAELEAPRRPELGREDLEPAELAPLLGLITDDFLDLGGASNVCSCGFPFLMAPVRSAAVVDRAVLDSAAATRRLRGASLASSVYLFAEAAPGAIVARMFAPADGIPEDPATGSAAAAVAGWLATRASADGDYAWRIEQGAGLGRPSVLYARAERRAGLIERACVGGRSRVFSRGKFRIP
jgi:trans-2,3-dihydro-3-hydroxyanthranilate isomerase